MNNVTFSNIYLESGTDSQSRSGREHYCGEVIPDLLVNRGHTGCVGGDFNCIIDKKDATNHAQAKMSPNLKRLVKTFQWKDSFRTLYPQQGTFSHYYKIGEQSGASRIDTQYHWGQVEVNKSQYIPAAFSDHLGLLIEIKVPCTFSRDFCPPGQPHIRIRDEVAHDEVFKQQVATKMFHYY